MSISQDLLHINVIVSWLSLHSDWITHNLKVTGMEALRDFSETSTLRCSFSDLREGIGFWALPYPDLWSVCLKPNTAIQAWFQSFRPTRHVLRLFYFPCINSKWCNALVVGSISFYRPAKKKKSHFIEYSAVCLIQIVQHELHFRKIFSSELSPTPYLKYSEDSRL